VSARLTESVADQLISIIQARLADELAITIGHYGGAIPLDIPAVGAYHVAPVLGLRLPMVVIDPTQLTFTPDAAENFVNADLSMRVSIVSENREYETLTRQIWRYGVCLYRAVHDQPVVMDTLHGRVRVDRITYSDWGDVSPDTQSYRRAATAECVVKFLETF